MEDGPQTRPPEDAAESPAAPDASARATADAAPPTPAEVSRRLGEARETILAETETVVVGMGEIVDLILIGIVAGGHLLFEGVPGMAKTLLVKTLADLLGCEFSRIQFTPDLLPADITGSYVFNRESHSFELHKGALFAQIVLADEINRAPSKTQSALLEAMQERQITIEGRSFSLDPPFIVMATQNPVEQEGVYRLPEAQLDRFFMRVLFGYPKREDELKILKIHSAPLPNLSAVLDAPTLARFQEALPGVHLRDELYGFIVDLGARTREHDEILLGASPRALVALVRAARARALLQGRDYATHEDIRRLASPVLNHRLILRPEVEIEGRTGGQILDDILRDMPVYDAS